MPHSADSSSSAASSEILSLSTAASSTTNPPNPPEATTTLTLPPRDDDSVQLSPGVAGFAFPEFNTDSVRETSHADRRDMDRSQEYRSDVVVQSGRDAALQRQQSNRKRSQWYDDQFAVKSPGSPAVERICKDAPVIAELRTNVIVKDEYTLVTDLSSHLSERFHRPEASIMITLAHSACLMFGGTFEPAYLLTISTLPQFMQPVTNKRNTALTQAFMADVLGVPPDRGIIHFKAIPDENLGYGGKTVFAQIEQTEETNGLKRGNTNSRLNRKSLLGEKRKSLLGRPKDEEGLQRHVSTKSFKSTKSGIMGQRSPRIASPEPMPKTNGALSPPLTSPTNAGFGVSLNGQTPNSRPMSSKKSILKMTGQDQTEKLLAPPPIPEDTPTPKISKRKSLVAMFKR